MSTFIEPNTFDLNDFHGNLRVTFHVRSGALPGSSRDHRVTYQDKTMSKEFLAGAVHVVATQIGRLVTVVIRQSPEGGSTSFSFLVPRVNLLVDGSNRAPVETEGITTTHRQAPLEALNRGQREVYSVVPLIGTASVTTLSFPPQPEHRSSTPPPAPLRTPIPPQSTIPPSMFPRRKP